MVTTTSGESGAAEVVETGERRDALGRRRMPVERRGELLSAYLASGLTQREFARREGLNYTTFCTWAQAERRRGSLPVAPAGKRRQAGAVLAAGVPFLEVEASASIGAFALEVRLADGTLVRGGDAVAVAKLVRALRA